MTVLVDTSVLVDHLRGYSPATGALRELVHQGRPRCASVLTRMEILRGLPQRQIPAWNALASTVTWLPVDVLGRTEPVNWRPGTAGVTTASIPSTTSSPRPPS